MKNYFKTSVIIPCFNAERYLHEALESVRSQTVTVREIIVVDDGSSSPVLGPRGWDGPPLHIIRTLNQGQSVARNLGIKLATGEFVAFLDSDDLWEPTKIEEQERVLLANPSASGCYTRCVTAPGFFAFGPYPPSSVTDEEFLAVLWHHAFFPPSSVLIRRSALDASGHFREDLRYSEDVELWIRLLMQGRFIQVAKALCRYRQHPGQFTSDTHRKLMGLKLTRSIIIIKHKNSLIKSGWRPDRLWAPYRNEILLSYYRRDFETARPLLWDYWWDHPLDLPIFLRALVSALPAAYVTRIRGRIQRPDCNPAHDLEIEIPGSGWEGVIRSISPCLTTRGEGAMSGGA